MNIKSFLPIKITLSVLIILIYLLEYKVALADPAIPMYHLVQTEISDTQLKFTINFTPDQIKSFQIFNSIDSNRNGILDESELKNYGQIYANNFILTYNDKKLNSILETVEVTSKDKTTFVNNQDSSLYSLIIINIKANIDRVDNLEKLVIKDNNSFDGSDTFGFTTPINSDNISLICTNSISANEIDIRFTSYDLASKFECNSTPLNNIQPTQSKISTPIQTNQLTQIINSIISNPIYMFMGLLIAILLGMQHALLPGHAKTLIFLSSTSTTKAVLKYLAVSIIIAHGLSDIIIGLIIIGFSEVLKNVVNSSLIINLVGLSSSVIIIIYGIVYIRKFFVSNSKELKEDYKIDIVQLSKRKAIGLGIISGIAPSPIVISALIYSYAISKLYIGLILITLFSLGFAITMICMSLFGRLMFIKLERRINRYSKITQYQKIIIGVLILLSGIISFIQFVKI